MPIPLFPLPHCHYHVHCTVPVFKLSLLQALKLRLEPLGTALDTLVLNTEIHWAFHRADLVFSTEGGSQVGWTDACGVKVQDLIVQRVSAIFPTTESTVVSGIRDEDDVKHLTKVVKCGQPISPLITALLVIKNKSKP